MYASRPSMPVNVQNRQQENLQRRNTPETTITTPLEGNQIVNSDDTREDQPSRENETDNGRNDEYLNYVRQQTRQTYQSTSAYRRLDRGININQSISDHGNSGDEIEILKSFNSRLINEMSDHAKDKEEEISMLKVKILEYKSIIETILKDRDNKANEIADLKKNNNKLAEENKRYENRYGLSHSYVFDYYNIKFYDNGEIGSGTYSFVYQVTIENEPSFTEQYYAVKIYRKTVEDMEKRDWEKFNNELTINILISHPFIVKFFGYSDVSGSSSSPSLLFEYVENGNLYQWIQNSINKEYDPKTRAKFIMQIAIALLYLHEECRIIHRDLKLSNILIDRENNIKICDFGEAMICNNSIKQECNVGTPSCRAPEAKASFYTQKCDVYSFGVMIYRLITNDLSGNINLDELIKYNVVDYVPELINNCICQEFEQRYDIGSVCSILLNNKELIYKSVETTDITFQYGIESENAKTIFCYYNSVYG